jgi:SAM-dependent methyltransferase
MTVEAFFELFLEELRQSPQLTSYYKFLENDGRFVFRKAYFIQRLAYIRDHILDAPNPSQLRIWDCGCGYGTTAFYLAMNGIPCLGSTLEFYYEHLPARFAFWQQHGQADLFTVNYENLFDSPPPKGAYDRIIVQDTLHHLEPNDQALKLLRQGLAPSGKVILIEENGDNIIQNLKLFKQRGFKRVITIYDEKLQKHILLGNENIRGLDKWTQLFRQAGMEVSQPEYVRYLLPGAAAKKSVEEVIRTEQTIAKHSPFKRKYRFFGINFIAKSL